MDKETKNQIIAAHELRAEKAVDVALAESLGACLACKARPECNNVGDYLACETLELSRKQGVLHL